MPLVKVKPTSPGRRALVKVVNPTCTRVRRSTSLVERQKRGSGRTTTATSRCGTRAAATSSTTASSTSSATRTAFRPRSSGSNTIRTAAPTSRCCCTRDGERRYIIAPRGVAVGTQLHVGHRSRRSSRATACRCATSRSARPMHCIEMQPGKGAQIARSAGASAQLLAREGIYAQLRHALRRDPQGARRLPRDDRRSRQRRAQPALDRQGGRQSLARHPPDRARHLR